MKTQYFFLYILAATLLVFSCKKADEDLDETRPTISISSPAVGVGFTPGDTMHVSVTVEDDVALHEAEVQVLNSSNNDSLLAEFGGHSHDNPTHVHGEVILDLPMHTDVEVKVSAEDESGNTNTTSRHVHVQ